MKYEIGSGGHSIEVDFETEKEILRIKTGDRVLNLHAVKIQPGMYSVLLNNRSFVVGIDSNGIERIHVNGTPLTVELLDAVHLHLRELGWDTQREVKAGLISAQIPGLITKIYHTVGDQVDEGEPLFLIEAMKMENEIKAPISGTIQRIGVKEGQTVEKGTNIIEIG